MNTPEPSAHEPLFVPTGHDSPIAEFAISLLALDGVDYFAQGTAIIIAPHLALTATHVLRDFEIAYRGRQLRHGETGKHSVQAAQVLEGGASAALWAVTKYFTDDKNDICVLELTPASAEAQQYTASHRWRGIPINLMPPLIGSRVSAFGYINPSAEKASSEAGTVIKWSRAGATTSGKVVDIFPSPEGRDRGMLPFPCFQTDARFDPSMSGGPIFNDEHELCGLVATGMPPGAPGEAYSSYGSILWPLVAIVMGGPRYGHRAGTSFPFAELIRDGVVTARHFDKCVVTPEGDQYRYGIQFTGSDWPYGDWRPAPR